MDPREYDWQMGDLARQDIYPDERGFQPPPAIPASTGEGYAGLGGDPSHLATTIKNWWINQPSWLDKAKSENQKTIEAYGRGGMGEIAKQLATDTTEAQDLVSAFGVGNIKGVGSKVLAPGALAATSEYRPPFYSAVEQAVQGAKQNAAPGQQWAGFLRNQPGVKPEEVEALKLGKLFEQPGSVPKEAVLGEIAANRVNVGEVVLGGGVKHKFGTPEEQAAALQRRETAKIRLMDTDVGSPDYAARAIEFTESERALKDIVPGWGRAEGSGEFIKGGDTKFGQYTLPGGENYREMLLTLPSKARAPTSADIKISKDRDPLSGTPMWRANVGDYFVGRYGSQEHAALEANRWISEKPDNFKEGTFRSSHFDEPNVLAHVRYNDRVIDGKKTLFVEEVQSDWHQKGKREGYAEGEPKTIPTFKPDELKIESREHDYFVTSPDGRQVAVGKGIVGSEAEAREYMARYMNKQAAERNMEALTEHRARVPDAPFKTTWPELAMKRIIREAAEKGYDKVAWTPGSVQAERYDLSKHIDRLHYNPDKKELRAFKDNQMVVNKDNVDAKDLADIVGKDVAEKLINAPLLDKAPKPAFGKVHMLEGVDLKVGGEGMKGFYDEILPATVNRLVKKHGGRVQQGQLADEPRKGKSDPATDQLYRELAGEEPPTGPLMTGQKVHTIDITPSLRAAAMKGFPLFSAGGVAATGAMGELARQDEYQ